MYTFKCDLENPVCFIRINLLVRTYLLLMKVGSSSNLKMCLQVFPALYTSCTSHTLRKGSKKGFCFFSALSLRTGRYHIKVHSKTKHYLLQHHYQCIMQHTRFSFGVYYTNKTMHLGPSMGWMMSARTEETRVFACCLISDTIMLKKRFYLLRCSEGNRKTLHNMHTFLSA